jgi:hypothetical protein
MKLFDYIRQVWTAGQSRILLSVPAYFPSWHSRFGQETGFRERILDKSHRPKIHAFKKNTAFWQKMEEKYRTGRYHLVVCHRGDDPYRREYYPVIYPVRLHIQRARFAGDDSFLHVEGKPVAMETVARNEGLEVCDLLEWKKRQGEEEFCIVHFTDFRY